MTKTARRRVNARIRTLQHERKSWAAGHYWPWGTPWCNGPGDAAHQPPRCEGCAVRDATGDILERIDDELRQLQAALIPGGQPVQGGLW